MITRFETRKVRVGNMYIGGDSQVTVQSMTNTDTRDVNATVNQIRRLEDAGCDIIRVAVPDREASDAIRGIRKAVRIPLVADIHFDYRLALSSMENGADKIRINPGNIGSEENVKKVVNIAKERGIPIRIGVNSGSLEKHLLNKYLRPTPEAMVESALWSASILEKLDFQDIVISLKASSVSMTIEAYRLMAKRSNYPLHIGVTEAGTVKAGTVKSAIGIGCLLAEGIGDTLRVSLTGDPAEEVFTGIEILKALDMRSRGIELVSCPTCGRCNVNLINIAEEAEKRFKVLERELGLSGKALPGQDKNPSDSHGKSIKVAIMGCAVNGPGEAKEADIGIAGGINEFLLFKKGQAARKVSQDDAVEELVREVRELM